MNLNHLAIFQAVAQKRSVSGGAQHLHISQSAVSKQLSEFERKLGVTLFNRLPRGMQLTKAGHTLLGYANRLFAIEAEAESAIGEIHDLVRGRIAIGASRTIGGYLLPQTLAEFKSAFPGIDLSLQVENTRNIEQKLLAGDIDIGFSEGAALSTQIDYRTYAKDELIVVTSPDHPLHAGSRIPIYQLLKYPILMHEEGSGTRAVTERAFQRHNIELRPAMTLASTEALKHTAATGAGITILSAFAVRNELQAGSLKQIKVKGLKIQRPLYRMQLRNAWPGPALDAFLALLDARPGPKLPAGLSGK